MVYLCEIKVQVLPLETQPIIICDLPMTLQPETFLGSGTFSNVYLFEKDGKKYARKKVTTPLKASLSFLYSELNTSKICRHPNIVRYYSLQMSSFMSIDFILEFIDGGTMKGAYKTDDQELLLFWLYQLCLGLSYMEDCQIVHRDIKPSNILVDNSGIVKLSDFGSAKFVYFFDTHSEMVGTPAFLPPELLLKNQYSYKSDIWSLGISFYDLIHKRMPFPDNQGKQSYFKKIINNRIAYDNRCSSDMKMILSTMLRRNPSNRLSAKQILEHPVLQSRKERFQLQYEKCLQRYYEKNPDCMN